MTVFYFSTNISDDHILCLAPLTDRKIALADQEIADSSGYFLYELRGRDDAARVEVIAHVPTEEGALRLRDMLGLS